MDRPYIFNRKGEPIDIPEFDELLHDVAYCHVAITAVGDLTISTIWLGVNHNFLGEGPPILFETMVFGPGDAPMVEEMQRWPTEEAALAGHDQVVAAVRQAVAETQ